MKVDVTIKSERLAKLSAILGGAQLLAVMGAAVKEETRSHLAVLAQNRHATADRVGGKYTGFLADAAQAVEQAPLTVEGNSASFVIHHPGMGRAFHPVTIIPQNGSMFIPIALNAIAYGRSPREFSKNIFIRKGAGGGGKKEHQTFASNIPAWLLVRSVTQKQDRALLPSDRAWKEAAITAAEELIQAT